MNLIANGSHFSFLFCCCFFFLNFLSYTGLVIQVHIVKYFFTSLSPFYSFFVFCIRTCEKFTLVNYIVFLVFFCYAALHICVGWSGFCVYCAGTVRFFPQLWLTFFFPANNSQRQGISPNLRFLLDM